MFRILVLSKQVLYSICIHHIRTIQLSSIIIEQYYRILRGVLRCTSFVFGLAHPHPYPRLSRFRLLSLALALALIRHLRIKLYRWRNKIEHMGIIDLHHLFRILLSRLPLLICCRILLFFHLGLLYIQLHLNWQI